MDYEHIRPSSVLHWNYRGLTEFPINELQGEEPDVTDIYLKENLISQLPNDIGSLVHLESLYISGNDITELPKTISHLKCLKCLDVSGNRLKKIPNEIGDVRNLKFLILDENELTELPLRLAQLRYLRYLSVCDNKLKWLPQRPVYNYHHCEFRFWRNPELKSLPYSLWYHMFRNQQTRSLNIACLNTSYTQKSKGRRCRLKLNQDSKEWDFDVDYPKYNTIYEPGTNTPPTLYELCKRIFYHKLSDTARKMSSETYSNYSNNYCTENNNISTLQNGFNNFNIRNTSKTRGKMEYYMTGDIINEYYNFLPSFMKEDLVNGPITKCENVECKKPVFDYLHCEFSIGTLILIDSTQDVILSAGFCSKVCAEQWKKVVKTIPWCLVEENN